MLKWLFPQMRANKEFTEQIVALWKQYYDLAAVVEQITAVMREQAEFTQQMKADLDHLAKSTFMIADTQNRLIAHLTANEGFVAANTGLTLH